jgi:hypothetical protein
VSGALERWSGEEQTLQTLLCQHAAPIAEVRVRVRVRVRVS